MATAEPLRRNIARRPIVAVHGGVPSERSDALAAEEPMEIRVGGPGQVAEPVAVTMRTPGGDFELAVGFLTSEGLIGPSEVVRVAYCDDLDAEEQRYNVVTVRLRRVFDVGALRRTFAVTSSCGVCGKTSIDDLEVHCAPVGDGPVVSAALIAGLPETLRSAQRVFDRTGGLHAAGLFDEAGHLLSLREDIGRHNAVDKVIGEQALAGNLPLATRVLQVSGRIGFEIVQKAAVAGIPLVAAVGAPSSLAVDAADRFGLTLVGFVRDERFNVYTGPQRIAL